MQQLLHSVLEHIGSSISTAFANLPAGVSSAASGCPVECLGQYFMDLVFLDATLSKAGELAVEGSKLEQPKDHKCRIIIHS